MLDHISLCLFLLYLSPYVSAVYTLILTDYLFIYYDRCAFFSFFFFFSSRRRHTRYWRDWSSDVCSSDLAGHAGPTDPARASRGAGYRGEGDSRSAGGRPHGLRRRDPSGVARGGRPRARSEERRVGEECRSWGSPHPLKKTQIYLHSTISH